MTKDKIYPRTGDTNTVYLKNVVTGANIEVGDYTMYNDFAHDPRFCTTIPNAITIGSKSANSARLPAVRNSSLPVETIR